MVLLKKTHIAETLTKPPGQVGVGEAKINSSSTLNDSQYGTLTHFVLTLITIFVSVLSIIL